MFCLDEDTDNASENSNSCNDSGGSTRSSSTSGNSKVANSKSAKNIAEQKLNNNNLKTKYIENSTATLKKSQNGSYTNNIQKYRANCKPEELSKLKAKCEYLVRSCIGGLILSMTDHAFREMEGAY